MHRRRSSSKENSQMPMTKTIRKIKQELWEKHEKDSTFTQSLLDQAYSILDSLNTVIYGIGKKIVGLKLDKSEHAIEFTIDGEKFVYLVYGGSVVHHKQKEA